MGDLTVTSEIYAENDYKTKPAEKENYVITEFPFYYCDTNEARAILDEDGDFCVRRKSESKHSIAIEYSQSTTLKLVGLQVWRGAFLLADLILHYGAELISGANKEPGTVLELGSGSGLSGIVAAMKFDKVICTDINVGGILELIERNIERNKRQLRGKVSAMELDFKANSWPYSLIDELKNVNLIIAADVIYDNDLTEAFVKTLERLFAIPPVKTVFVALEKRYVFTVADMDTVAPCYEYFLDCLENARYRNLQKQCWEITKIDTDFPKYFEYDRCKELVLFKITAKGFTD